MITRISSAFYWTRDMDRAAAFYADVLGLPLMRRHGDGFAQFDAGGMPLGLHGPVDGVAPEGAGATVVLECDDLDATMKDLSAAGVTFEGDVTETPAGARFVGFRDPDGNLLQLIQPAAHR
ncbi:MAG TPA: VOC family protein [Actinomycetota bacterium]